jgi:hypothetical protein
MPLDPYPIAEAAALATMNPFTVWRWIRAGRVAAYGVRGSRRFSLSAILPEYEPPGGDRR